MNGKYMNKIYFQKFLTISDVMNNENNDAIIHLDKKEQFNVR